MPFCTGQKQIKCWRNWILKALGYLFNVGLRQLSEPIIIIMTQSYRFYRISYCSGKLLKPLFQFHLRVLPFACLAPKPQYFSSVIRFGSHGPRRKVWLLHAIRLGYVTEINLPRGQRRKSYRIGKITIAESRISDLCRVLDFATPVTPICVKFNTLINDLAAIFENSWKP